ncbi:MAG: hypothetical protein ACNA8W_17415, partial [Bradymonadaceae bacterium]
MMNNPGLIETIRAAILGFIELCWMAFAYALDFLRDLSALLSALVVFGIVSLCVTIALAMQRRLNKDLLKNPDAEAPIWWLELIFSAPGIFVRTLALPGRLFAAVMTSLGSVFKKKDASSEEEDKKAAEKKKEKEKEKDKPLVVATLGPSFMWGGLVT